MNVLRAIGVAVVISAVSIPARTFAQPADEARVEEAREYHRHGLALYARQKYEEAIEAFTKAYELSLASGILFNIAQAHRLLGHCVEAVKTYRRFIAEDPSHPNRKLAEDNLTVLGTCGGAAALEPAPKPASPPSSTSRFVAGPPEPREPAPPGRNKRLAGIGLASVGGVLVLGAIGFGVNAAETAGDLEELFENGAVPFDETAQALEQEYRSDRTKAVVLAILGLAAGGSGAYLYVRGKREGDAERPPTVTVSPVDGGAVMVLSGGF